MGKLNAASLRGFRAGVLSVGVFLMHGEVDFLLADSLFVSLRVGVLMCAVFGVFSFLVVVAVVMLC